MNFRWPLRNPMLLASGAVVAIVVALAVLAPWLAPHSPGASSLDAVLAPPSAEHPLGGDASGRDILSRLLAGAGATMMSAAIALVTALVVGFPSGVVAGYYGHWFDAGASWVMDLLMAAPAIVLLLTLAPIVDNDVNKVMCMLGVIISPMIFRLTRSTVRAVRDELFIDAARVFGISDSRIMARHVALSVRGPLIVASSLVAGSGILIQAGLEFIGIGDASRISWGAMLSESVVNMSTAPTLIIAPGLAIGVTASAIALFGSSLADALGGDRQPASAQAATVDALHPAVIEVLGEVRPRVDRSPDRDLLLQIEDLHVSYSDGLRGRTEVVSGVSLSVGPGEIVGLVGESGSGKSQTSFAALGLLPGDALVRAEVLMVQGHDVLSMNPKQRRSLYGSTLGYVPQEPTLNLDPCWSIGEQLIGPIRLHQGCTRKAARATAEALLDRVGIRAPADVMTKFPHEISGGMAQRVLIAGAISCEPRLLIADEPTTALDVTVQAEVLSLLRDLQQERQLGILLVTHNLGVVADLCDRVAVMRSGRVVEEQGAKELFAAPLHDYTRQLLRSTLDGAPPRAPYEGMALRDA